MRTRGPKNQTKVNAFAYKHVHQQPFFCKINTYWENQGTETVRGSDESPLAEGDLSSKLRLFLSMQHRKIKNGIHMYKSKTSMLLTFVKKNYISLHNH